MSEELEVIYEFDEDFQIKIAACLLKDISFNKRSEGLIKPEYFSDPLRGAIVNLIIKYFVKFEVVPSNAVLANLIKKATKAKLFRFDLKETVEEINKLRKEDITDVEAILEEVAEFATHQALEMAILKSAELLPRRDFKEIEKVIANALKVGSTNDLDMYEFFGDDEIDRREQIRVNRLAGISSTGAKTISTGIRAFDDILFHKGFARKEFYCFMGRAKIGKSIALAHFAKVTSLQGLNVLFVTLEVSKEITAERIDAAITNVPMRELEKRISEIKEKIQELKDKSGKLYIEERPPDSFTPRDLTKAIQKYKGMGVKFDMVVVDYADIMSPNVRTTDAIENSKSVYLALRAIAMVEDVVMLSAMQTNREGAKSPVAKMEHAAEDFNKIRIPDLVISINATDEELAEKEARLYFAASRNQQGNFSIVIEQDLEAMQFLKRIVSIE